MSLFQRGGYTVRQATDPQEIQALQRLRARCFDRDVPLDHDDFDARALHFGVYAPEGDLLGCYRLTEYEGAQITQSYAAQTYDVAPLTAYRGVMLELGRFCVDPDTDDPEVLRTAWAALTQRVDARGVTLLFGCSSFAGTDPAPYADALALLRLRHLGPELWRPKRAQAGAVRFCDGPAVRPDLKQAQRSMPPLLRTYLLMGGWVSDHAVIDPVMNTLHVFTGLEIAKIPPARKRLLRALV